MKAVTSTRALLVEPDVKRSRVRLLVTIVLVGTVASIVCHYVSGSVSYTHLTLPTNREV